MSLSPNDRFFFQLPCFLPLLSVPLTLVLATVEVVPALHKHYTPLSFRLSTTSLRSPEITSPESSSLYEQRSREHKA